MQLSEDELSVALNTLVEVGAGLQADCSLIHKRKHLTGGWVGVVMMRKYSDAAEALELRVACMFPKKCTLTFVGVGNVDAGKSTLLGILCFVLRRLTAGVLTKGALDDGRGKARVNLFRCA
jgi:GTPase